MSIPHRFLFTKGCWLGEGKVSFTTSSEIVRFYTSWEIDQLEQHSLRALQRVEMQGNEELLNRFTIFDITSSKFKIKLTNELVGTVEGQGLYDDAVIAWEFHHADNIDGFEVYERQDSGEYLLHAEYFANDLFRTVIDGHLWEKKL